MSRKPRVLFLFLALVFLLGCGISWAKTLPKKADAKTWVVHIQSFDVNGQTGLWPESTSTPGEHHTTPWLQRSRGDKIQFVIDSGASSCRLVFDDGTPLVPLGSPNAPAETISVFAASGNNGYYVVSPKLHFDKNQYCEYWFHILGNPPCAPRSHVCQVGTPSRGASDHDPCWGKDRREQIGPGMDTSD